MLSNIATLESNGVVQEAKPLPSEIGLTKLAARGDADSGLCCEDLQSKVTLSSIESAAAELVNKQTVKLNIGGTVFEVTLGSLKKIPETRLCKLADLLHEDESYRVQSDDYYFDRSPLAFGDILEYYRSGELHLDQSSCGAIFKKELEFWGLNFTSISMCCWSKYDSYRANNAIYAELDKLFAGPANITTPGNPNSKLSWAKFYVFQILENPSFSIGAKIFIAISFFITTGSIFTFVAETHYVFKQLTLDNGTMLPAPAPVIPPTPKETQNCYCYFNFTHMTNHTPDSVVNATHNETDLEHRLHDKDHIDSHIVLHYLDFITFGYFVMELFLRFLVSYDKKAFCKQIINVVELICVVAHFTAIIEHVFTVDKVQNMVHVERAKYVVYLLKSLRIMRVFRIFRLFRHMTGFKVLVYTIAISFNELILILSFLFAGVLIFASIMFYVEEETFTSIPYAIWYALVTMTTVGYGDVVPKTPMGYFIGALCVVSGALVVAFTVPVVVNNFTLYYALSKSRKSKVSQSCDLKFAKLRLGSLSKLIKHKRSTRVIPISHSH